MGSPKPVLVIGGGVAGVQAALDLANAGIKACLLDTSPSIGGHMAQLDKTFPTNDCSMCILAPRLVEAGRNDNIELMTYSELLSVEGEAPNFKVRIKRKPTYVKWDLCTGCGTCAEKCPIKRPNEFDYGLSRRKAIYIQFPQAVPNKAVIDEKNCLFFRVGKCRLCEKECPANAIDFDQKECIDELEVNSIILATGYDQLDPSFKKEYGYGLYDDVITGLEFERLMNASGPTMGEIKRKNGEKPKKIAIIHCAGSRDEKAVKYCSRVCCTYAIKQAIIAKEHDPDIDITLFYMDMRTFGKGFEEYKEDAKGEIQMKRGRVAEVNQVDDGLEVVYADEGEEVKKEIFDMVVLESAIIPSKGVEKMADMLSVELDESGFFKEKGALYPLHSSREGIFLAGCSQGPKDIPDSVAQASGAASLAQGPIDQRVFPEEPEMEPIDASGEPRIGVFICHCGINIGKVVDIPQVVEYAKKLPHVAYVERNLYTCSDDTQKLITEKIRERGLNRVVVAACTPRTHQPLFQKTLERAGLNPYLFEFANIRDQCSWVHMHEPEKATEKAKDLVRMAVAKVALQKPLIPHRVKVTKSALVIGGGISGMVSALDLADQGIEVHLVEKGDELGGMLKSLGRLAISEQSSRDLLAELRSLIERSNVVLHLGAEVEEAEGFIGDFKILLSSGEELNVGTIIVAIGSDLYVPKEYGYGTDPRVVTNLDFEKLDLKGKKLVFIQCIGARDEEFKGCSRYCCQTTLGQVKQALEAGADVTVLHKDIRAFSKGAEELYRKVAEMGARFIRFSEEPELVDGNIGVQETDISLDLDFDHLVLASSMRPPKDALKIQKLFKIPLDGNGYFLESHPKLGPVETNTDGIFLAGTCQYPKDLADAIAQAHGASAKALVVLSRDFAESEPITAEVDKEFCHGCGTCIEICPFRAITLDDDGLAEVNEVLCKGCGSCAAVCPWGAITQNYFSDEQLSQQIRAIKEVAS
jgi:heterodisulfide reductase subunit A